MIDFKIGNLFESDAEALVNTVNCVGVMGKGIAHQFKRAYPAMFKEYQARCRAGEVRLGQMTTFRAADRLIINFPTKDHWRSKSKLDDVTLGLESLRTTIEAEGLASVAIPPLGCGNGGLRWSDVQDQISEVLGGLEGVQLEVFEPVGRSRSEVATEPKLSLSHYVLAALRLGLQRPNRLNLQKAAYFFNVAIGDTYFRFDAHKYGPFCGAIPPMSTRIRDYLDHAVLTVEEMIADGVRRRLSGKQVDQFHKWGEAIDAATGLCNRNNSAVEAIATAHAVLQQAGPTDEACLIEGFLSWSEEKKERYSEPDVLKALEILEREQLVTRTLLGIEISRGFPRAK